MEFSDLKERVINFNFEDALNNDYTAFIAQFASQGGSLIGISDNMKSGEHYSSNSKIPSFPLEDGSIVSDHIINEGLVIEQRFIVSVYTNSLLIGTLTLAPINFFINNLRNSKRMYTILTNHAIYRNMAIESINNEVSSDVMNKLTCDIRFKEILFAKSTTSKVGMTSLNTKINEIKNKIFGVSSEEVKKENSINVTQSPETKSEDWNSPAGKISKERIKPRVLQING